MAIFMSRACTWGVVKYLIHPVDRGGGNIGLDQPRYPLIHVALGQNILQNRG